jgi:putative transposase
MGAHTKSDLKAHIVWVPKYRKRILLGEVSVRLRDILKQICLDQNVNIISGKISIDHVHMFISYMPSLCISKCVQHLKGSSARILFLEFPHLKKVYWGRHLWSRGYLAVSSGNITDELIQKYIDEQEGEPVVDDGRFEIDN